VEEGKIRAIIPINLRFRICPSPLDLQPFARIVLNYLALSY